MPVEKPDANARVYPRPLIAVVIPAYNAAKSIEIVLNKIPAVVDLIVVVNDASPDNLEAVVSQSNDPRVHLLTHLRNQGVGGAVLTGYAYALEKGADIVVKIDSDDQMDLDYFEDLITPLLGGEADYAKGNRFLHPHELKRMPLIRRIGNQGLSFLAKVATGYWKIYDPTNGYTAITRQVLQRLDADRISRHFFFETSMLAELRKLDAVVEDVPIPAIYNEHGSSIRIPREFFRFSANLTYRIFERVIHQYYRFDFSAVSFYLLASVILGVFGGVWGIVKWVKSDQTGIPATTGTVLIAVLPIILAVQFFVQAVALDIDSTPSEPLARRPRRNPQSTSKLAARLQQLKACGDVRVVRGTSS
jgi:glycosyltransferase involved in cell wall biosynthesis